LNKSLSVPPGQTVPVELVGSALNEDIYTLISVTAPDGQAIYYLRDFQCALSAADVWTPDETAARKIQTLFAYYPSANTIRFSGGHHRVRGVAKKFRSASVVVRRKGAAKPIAGAGHAAVQ